MSPVGNPRNGRVRIGCEEEEEEEDDARPDPTPWSSSLIGSSRRAMTLDVQLRPRLGSLVWVTGRTELEWTGEVWTVGVTGSGITGPLSGS